ncbi:hypothetical protein R1flu_021535 [Riccia fluitans]|uniref:Uncharacterized protein n=1 Tax=Riccia fluitans TaxID=41844 RepID=A0ABD1ZQU0_9MARC
MDQGLPLGSLSHFGYSCPNMFPLCVLLLLGAGQFRAGGIDSRPQVGRSVEEQSMGELYEADRRLGVHEFSFQHWCYWLLGRQVPLMLTQQTTASALLERIYEVTSG